MRKILLACLFLSFITTSELKAQSCFNFYVGNDTTISCLNACLTLKAKIPNIKSSEDYNVISIPYNPYPFVTTAPAYLHPCLAPGTGQDDKFYAVTTLPFNFCFYGSIATQFVVGSNGVISFNLGDALQGNNYVVDRSIPWIGAGNQGSGACPSPDGVSLYPKPSIMGALQDIYPDIGDTANYKIESRMEGSAPCRRYVLSFYNVRLYNCQSLRSTFEIVLHEGTGLIDVFVKDKPFCSVAGSNTIIGIQKDGTPGSLYASPPGRNSFTQAISNEGWRFVPNGPTSLLSHVDLYKNGVLVTTGTTVDLGNGELEASFPNVCQTEDSMSYEVHAYYHKCDNPAIETEGSDTIIVYKTLNPLTVNTTATTCPTSNNGKITVADPVGANIEYSINGGATWQSSPVFNVIAGTYTVIARVVGSTCTGSTTVTVAAGSTALTSTITATSPPCANINNAGMIVVNPTSGTAPYQYQLNGGTPQASNTFSGLTPGPYTIDFVDANGCTGTNNTTLTSNPAITSTTTLADPLCNGNANGSITMNASGGVPPYQYSKNGGATYQASPVFSGLIAGSYTIRIKDAAGCIYDFPYTLNDPAVLGVSSSSTIATCNGNDGSILVSETGGTPTYTYSIDGGVNYFPTSIFNNLVSGTYNVKVKDANGCTASTTETVALNDTMRLDLGLDSTICFGSSITLLPQTNAATDTFKWTPRAGLDYDTVRNPIATPNDTTKYYLHAKWGVCFRDDSITINVLHKPIPLAGKDTTICYKSFAILNGSVANTSGPVTYAWTPSATVVPPTLPIAVATPDSTQQYVLTVKDSYGCNFTVTDSMWVIMEAPVPAFAGNDTTALLDQPHHLKATGGVSYLWSPAGPLNDPTLQKPTAILHNDTYFRVWVTDAIGCKAFDDVFIKVYAGPEYYLPNAFTPNGDGLNDIFRPIPVGMKSTDYFMVYDRYGELLFQTREWMKGWDGRIKGKDAPMGTYVWIIRGHDENNQLMEKKGTVTLIR